MRNASEREITPREKRRRASFFSLPAACHLFSRGMIFTRARVSLALLSLRKNGGLLVVYARLHRIFVVSAAIGRAFAFKIHKLGVISKKLGWCGIYRSSKVFKLFQNGHPPQISIISIHLFLVAVDLNYLPDAHKTRYRISSIKHFALVFKALRRNPTVLRLPKPTFRPSNETWLARVQQQIEQIQKLCCSVWHQQGKFRSRLVENYNLTLKDDRMVIEILDFNLPRNTACPTFGKQN